MARILLLLAIGFIIWLLFRSFFRSQMKDESSSEPRDVEDMVACSKCGVNMPRSESREADGAITCRDPATCKHGK